MAQDCQARTAAGRPPVVTTAAKTDFWKNPFHSFRHKGFLIVCFNDLRDFIDR